MNCNNFRELILTDYADGQLGPEKQQLLDSHLRDCIACRNLAASIKESSGTLSNLPRIALDREKIWQKISAEIGNVKAPSIVYEPDRRVSILNKLFPRLKPAFVGMSLVFLNLTAIIYAQYKRVETANLKEKEEEVLY